MTEMVKFFREKCQTLVRKQYICQRKKGEHGYLCIKFENKSWKIICNIFICFKFNDEFENWQKSLVLEVVQVYATEHLDTLTPWIATDDKGQSGKEHCTSRSS